MYYFYKGHREVHRSNCDTLESAFRSLVDCVEIFDGEEIRVKHPDNTIFDITCYYDFAGEDYVHFRIGVDL